MQQASFCQKISNRNVGATRPLIESLARAIFMQSISRGIEIAFRTIETSSF
jgi:hypothetical protein